MLIIVFGSDQVTSRGSTDGLSKVARLHPVAATKRHAHKQCSNARPAALSAGSLRGGGSVWCSSYRQGAVPETGEVSNLWV